MTNTPQDRNVQDGQPLASGEEDQGRVAHGERRDVHYEPDPDQLVVARALEHPAAPLPPEEQSAQTDQGKLDPSLSAVTDVRVAPPEPSVWDARPPADDEDKSGNPTGH